MQKEEFCPIPETPELQWLALSLVPGLGFRSIQEMLNAGKNMSELLQATPGELVRDLGINSKVANKSHQHQKQVPSPSKKYSSMKVQRLSYNVQSQRHILCSLSR